MFLGRQPVGVLSFRHYFTQVMRLKTRAEFIIGKLLKRLVLGSKSSNLRQILLHCITSWDGC